MDADLAVFTHPARIMTRAVDLATIRRLAEERAPDPSVFEEFPPFVWACQISSTRLDAYYTAMDAATTLPNFAADAAAGRAFLVGHNNREMPFGYTLSGELLQDADGHTAVQAGAYTLQEPATEPFRNRTRAGIQRDVSVGFHKAKFICSICQRDMLRDWDCWHKPGFEYEVQDTGSAGATASVRTVLCTALVVVDEEEKK
jgi:hypothetical protein